jgi:predicted small lipoprotein YifL
MKNLVVLATCLSLTGCATINPHNQPDQQRAVGYHIDREIAKQDTMTILKTVGTIVVVGAIAGALGKQNQQSKCANNRAGFWQDHTSGKIYTCP